MISYRDFEDGVWTVSREIDDRRGGYKAQFSGQAVVRSGWYCEDGHLHLPGQPPMQASRRYEWRGTGQGRSHGIDVFFEDGGFFHHIELGGGEDAPKGQRQAAHFCDPDQYNVTYDFGAWPEWSAIWAVKGPRKDYVMTSYYLPLAL